MCESYDWVWRGEGWCYASQSHYFSSISVCIQRIARLWVWGMLEWQSDTSWVYQSWQKGCLCHQTLFLKFLHMLSKNEKVVTEVTLVFTDGLNVFYFIVSIQFFFNCNCTVYKKPLSIMKEAGIKCQDTFTGINCITSIKQKTNNTPLFGLDEELPLAESKCPTNVIAGQDCGGGACGTACHQMRCLCPFSFPMDAGLCVVQALALVWLCDRETMSLIWQWLVFSRKVPKSCWPYGQGLQQQVRAAGFRCLVAQTGDPQERDIAHVGGWVYFGVSEWPVTHAVSW